MSSPARSPAESRSGAAASPAVELEGIVKRFGALTANDGASLSVARGEIHALMGENGAGKSTLMRVLYGLYRPDAGRMRLGGREVRFEGPRDAIAAGVGMVHQHFMLVPTLTVAENVVLGSEPLRGASLDLERAERETAELSKRYGLALDPKAMVGDLSVGEEQRLEILKLLYRGAELLILDEPTAVLTPQETAAFFGVLKGLQAQGKTVVLITHKLQEALAISQRATVMRRGRTVGTVTTASTSEAELAQLMVGRPVLFKVKREARTPRELAARPAVLEVAGLSAEGDRGLPALREVSFKVRAGEIFGLAGVEGNGQSELIEALAGLRPCAGSVRLDGAELGAAPPAERHARGLAHVPADRHKRGLVLDFSVADNLVLGLQRRAPFNRAGRRDQAATRAFAERLIAENDVQPPDPDAAIRTLSGGNQQKVVVARELARDPRLLLAAQPTRGVDVGAIELIHKRLIERRDAGAAVLLVSAELSEILSLSDTVGVLYRGRLVAVLPIRECTEDGLGLLMAGGKA